MIGAPEILIAFVVLLIWASVIWPAARIARRLGFTPWLGVLVVIPMVNMLLLWFVALAEWPAMESKQP